MRLFTGRLQKLEPVFRRVYAKKDTTEFREPDGTWRANVMRKIRLQDSSNTSDEFLMRFEKFVWRLAPVACVLIILLAFWALQEGVTPDYEMAALVYDNPMVYRAIELPGG
jgi:hypothetical protein